MKTFFFTAIFLFVSTALFSQTFWRSSNGPQGSETEAIAVTSGGRIIIDDANNGGGIFYSDDGGKTWTHSSAGLENKDVSRLAINSNDVLFAGGNMNGLYRSTDLGVTWTSVVDWGYFDAIKINYDNSIFVSYPALKSTDNGDNWIELPIIDFSDFAFAINKDIFAARNGVYQSTDDGDEWNYIGPNDYYFNHIFVTSSGAVLAARGYFDGINLFRTTDDGNSWSSTGIGESKITAFAEDASRRIYAAVWNYGIFYSDDDGLTWNEFNQGLLDGEIWDLKIDDNNNLYAASDYSGPYFCEAGKETWQIISPNATNIRQIATDENGNVYALVPSMGRLFHSSDNGETWSPPYDSPEYGYSLEMFVASSDGTLFAATDNQILKSEDFGFTWETVFENDDSFYSIRHLAISPNDNLYAIRGKELIRSTDLGKNWDPIGKEAPEFVNALNVNSFETVFIGTVHGLFYSDNSGIDWEKAEDIPEEHVTLISSFRSYVFATTFENVGTGKYGLYFSSDNGKTWIKRNNGALGDFAKKTAFSNDGKSVYAITNDGSFNWSSDYGESWTELNDGLDEHTEFTTLSVNNNDEIFAGTSGRGVWKSSGPVTAVESDENELPSEFVLKQNYPNPFGKSSPSGNRFTTIEFTVPNSFSIVRSQLSVYDALGREIATLVDENKSPGTYKVDFDASKLSSGVYFYTLKAGSKAITKKMLILR